MGDIMNKLFSYFKKILLLIVYLFACSIISSIFYLYTNMSYNTNCLILFLLTAVGIFSINFLNGKKTMEKGYLEGVKLGSFTILVFFIISLFNQNFITISKFVYYGILILISLIASSLGINFKSKN